MGTCDTHQVDPDLPQNFSLFLMGISLTLYRYANRSTHFMDAYRKGLTGTQAIWANRKYYGHRVLSENILAKLEAERK